MSLDFEDSSIDKRHEDLIKIHKNLDQGFGCHCGCEHCTIDRDRESEITSFYKEFNDFIGL